MNSTPDHSLILFLNMFPVHVPQHLCNKLYRPWKLNTTNGETIIAMSSHYYYYLIIQIIYYKLHARKKTDSIQLPAMQDNIQNTQHVPCPFQPTLYKQVFSYLLFVIPGSILAPPLLFTRQSSHGLHVIKFVVLIAGAV